MIFFFTSIKSAGGGIQEALQIELTKAKLFYTKRISVYWGHMSQVDCEMLLIKECLSHGDYQYVHLLSGVDLPIKTQSEIHAFFDAHPNSQFLQVGVADQQLYRLSRFHFTVNWSESRFKTLVENINDIVAYKFKINRLNKYKNITIIKTANWFSITGGCAKYLYSQRKFIKKLTRYTSCADEMFLGTVLYASKYWSEVYNPKPSRDGHMRYIDWIRHVGASPHTFTMEDKESLDTSQMLFARKFSEDTDKEIIDYIFEKYKGK